MLKKYILMILLGLFSKNWGMEISKKQEQQEFYNIEAIITSTKTFEESIEKLKQLSLELENLIFVKKLIEILYAKSVDISIKSIAQALGAEIWLQEAIKREPAEKKLANAARKGDFKMVKTLVEKEKVDPNGSFLTFSPLCEAIKTCHLDIAEYLLEHGADVNRFSFGKIPLAEAIIPTPYPESVALLLKYRANPYIKDGNGKTVFDHIQKDINALQNPGETTIRGPNFNVLVLEKQQCYKKIIKLLVEKSYYVA